MWNMEECFSSHDENVQFQEIYTSFPRKATVNFKEEPNFKGKDKAR